MGRVATELVAGVVVGTLIGWALDRWLDTSPPIFAGDVFYRGDRWHVKCLACVHGAWISRRLFLPDEHKNSSDKNYKGS